MAAVSTPGPAAHHDPELHSVTEAGSCLTHKPADLALDRVDQLDRQGDTELAGRRVVGAWVVAVMPGGPREAI